MLKLWKKFTTGSVNRQIFGAAMIIAIMTILVKAVAMVKEGVVAWRFGTQDVLDAFVIAAVVPSLMSNVIVGSFETTLIPVYIQVREKDGNKEAQKIFATASICAIMVLLVVMLLMIAFANLYLPIIAKGFSPDKLELTFKLLYWNLPLLFLDGITRVWGSILEAGEKFALSSLVPMFSSIFIMVGLLTFPSWGIFAMVGGLILGSATQLFCLGIALSKQGVNILPRWHGWNEDLQMMAQQFAPKAAGSFLMCSSNIVDQSMAAMLIAGSVSSLSYGQKLIALPLNLSATALGTAVVPYFSKMVAKQEWHNVRQTLKKYLKLLFLMSIPVTLGLIFLSEPIVRLLFERGEFNVDSTTIVSQIQVCYAFQIPFYIGAIFVVRLITSMQLSQILVWGSALNLIVNIIGNYIFMKWIGVAGIALSTSLVYVVSFVFLFVFIWRTLNQYCSYEVETKS